MSDSHGNGHGHGNGQGHAPRTFEVRVLRQDTPDGASYWERHRLQYEPDMNVTSVLQRIAAQSETIDGRKVAPVAYDANCLEEVCGSCTMIINGRVRQACSALVDKLLEDRADEIELQPMSKFPVVRDLCVNRRRLFRSLEKVQAWIPVDGYYDMGPGPRQSHDRARAGVSAQPVHELRLLPGRLPPICPRRSGAARRARATHDFQKRENAVYDINFVGAAGISQAVLLQHASHRQAQRRRADRRADAAGRHPGLRQRPELRGGLPEADPADHFDRPGRPRRHQADVHEVV